MDIEQIKTVVIGGGHHNTLGVIRSLGEAKIKKNNIRLILVGKGINQNNFVAKTKYIRTDQISYVEDYNELLPCLLNLRNEYKQVIISCADGATEVLVENYDLLSDSFYLPSSFMSIQELMQKQYQDCIARECGMYVPKSAIIEKNSNIDWSIYPCIIKPTKSVLGAQKSDIKISQNKKELQKNLQESGCHEVQIQEYLKKSMEYQLIGCSLRGGEIIIIPGYTSIIRQAPNTNTGYLKYSPITELRYDKEAVTKFLQKIGYSGLFSIEFIRSTDEKDYFLEINMRNDGNAYCVKSAGINLPYIWCYYNVFGDLPEIPLTFEKSIFFMPICQDITRGIKNVGLLKWLIECVGAKSHAVFKLDDIKPFITKVVNYFIHKDRE